jgi:hypothetical protein
MIVMEMTMTTDEHELRTARSQVDFVVSMVSMTMMFAGPYECICSKQV